MMIDWHVLVQCDDSSVEMSLWCNMTWKAIWGLVNIPPVELVWENQDDPTNFRSSSNPRLRDDHGECSGMIEQYNWA